jgi:hypothetical protein
MKARSPCRLLMIVLAVVSTSVAAISCDSAPTAPSAANVVGTWKGSRCNPPTRAIACYLDLSISQTGSTLSGSYVTALGVGTLTGDVAGSTVSMLMTYSTLFSVPPGAAGPRVEWSANVTVRDNQMEGISGDGSRITATRDSR